MIAHYLAAALAKFAKAPFTTAANVLTLALGLACFIAAYGIATYWRSADGYHANADRIYVIGTSQSPVGQASPNPLAARSSATLAKYLREDFPDLERIARAYAETEVPVAAGQSKALLDAAFADPQFLEIFDFEYVEGDARALAEPAGVVLTVDAAARLFGDAPALGRAVRVDDEWDGTVTGVIRPVRQPSFMGTGPGATLAFDMLASWEPSSGGAARDAADYWTFTNAYTFTLFAPGASAEEINPRLTAFLERRIPAEQRELADISIAAFPVSEITTRALDNLLRTQDRVGVTAVSALMGLGVLILLIAATNYANLATAQAATRGKEIGMRRVLGAGWRDVLVHSWLEALVLTLAALVLALLALAAATPALRGAAGVDPLFFLRQGLFEGGARSLQILFALTAGVALVAGAYPALVLARIRPASALSAGRSWIGPRLIARVLVGVQFASASFLLILVTVAQLQRSHLESAALTSHGDPIVVLNDLKRPGVSFDTLESELARIPGVTSVTVSARPPWTSGASVIALARSLDTGASAPNGYLKQVGYDYFSTLGMDLLAGRAFDRARETTPTQLVFGDPALVNPVVIDRTYASRMGFAAPGDAVGETVYLPETITRAFDRPAQTFTIIGVVETDMMRMGASTITGHMYIFAPSSPIADGQIPIVRIDRDSLAPTLAAITELWDGLAPNVPLNVQFYDQLFEAAYQQQARVTQLFRALALTAFAIASIGQLGIAVHVVSRRRHEIGVRKVLGSTTIGVIRLLLVDFSKPVLVANLLAWPLAYLAAETYLSAFAHRVALTPAPFALSMAITLAIAWAAVIGEVLKAASVRPAEVLRHA